MKLLYIKMPKLPKPSKNLSSVIFYFISISLISISFLGISFEKKYQGKVYPGVILGQTKISGFTKKEVENLIENFSKDLEVKGIIFSYTTKTKDNDMQLLPRVIAASDPDLTYNLINIDTLKTINKVFRKGREGSFIQNFKTQLSLLKNPQRETLVVNINEKKIIDVLEENFAVQELWAKDAQLKIDESLKVIVIPEENGIIPNYELGLRQLRSNLENLSLENIVLKAKKDLPQVTSQNLLLKESEIEALLTIKTKIFLTFQYQNKERNWEIDRENYKEWIIINPENQLALSDKLNSFIKSNIAPEIELPAQEARFQITNGRVEEFKPSQEGKEIDYDKSLSLINQTFFDSNQDNKPIEIVIKTILPRQTTESVNNLGIKEIIGTGKSNFAGSPTNRRHNIRVGADTLNGVLILPGEEFSLTATLDKIEAESGYLPELVIKGNKTIPEFGGGLCQIGTTIFRGALDSGLKITERQNHSYRVSYYEPAGTDCTIYPPHPDCRFINDTGQHILLQTKIKGDDLIFEFWGTKDGRKVTITKPKIYDIVKPAPTKYIETEDLEEGKTNCTERAHSGAKTEFDYIVEYPNGTKTKETFRSFYKPWQAICLKGKKKGNNQIPKQDTAE